MDIGAQMLPPEIGELVHGLSTISGVVAVVLGGSRALGCETPESDWDLGVYYRGTLDLASLAQLGTVHPPGSWGRIMNGGAWLQRSGQKVDVLLRDLNVVDHWTCRAQRGEFEIDCVLGYIAGLPTYALSAELASCRVLSGELLNPSYPSRLASVGAARWRYCRTFSLHYARTCLQRKNVVAAVGQLAKATMEEAHARLCESKSWVCNEKRMLDAAGLGDIQNGFTNTLNKSSDLMKWLESVADEIGEKKAAAPWDLERGL